MLRIKLLKEEMPDKKKEEEMLNTSLNGAVMDLDIG